MTKLFFAASAAAMLTVAGVMPAMAQSSTSGAPMPMISCKDISAMDRETARGVVFYLSGFEAASGSMQNQASGSTGTSGSGTTDTAGASGSTAADAGTAGSTTGTTGSSDATGSTTTAGGSSGTSGSASGASGGASSMVMAQLPGFSSIDIDRVMSDCQSSPDRQLSEVLGMGASGTGTGTGTTTTP